MNNNIKRIKFTITRSLHTSEETERNFSLNYNIYKNAYIWNNEYC